MAVAWVPQDGTGVAAWERPDIGLDFSAVRAEMGLRADFPSAALTEAEQAVAQPVLYDHRVDATDLPLVTVDPPGAKDLDQAVLVRRRPGRGYRVHYAIADVAGRDGGDARGGRSPP